MFVPRTIPQPDELERHQGRFPQLDPTALHGFVHLLSVVRDAFEVLNPFFHARDLSQGRFCILMILFKEGEQALGPAEIADALGVSRASITGLVDGLVKLSLVDRSPHPSDRRKVICRLTKRGRELLEGFLPEHLDRVARIMSALSEDERGALNGLLGKIETGLEAIRIEEKR